MATIFAALLATGIAMPVLPLHVHEGPGLSAVVVGLVVGSRFVAALISRPLVGRHADILVLSASTIAASLLRMPAHKLQTA